MARQTLEPQYSNPIPQAAGPQPITERERRYEAGGYDPDEYRQSLINSGDIVSLSRNAAMIQVDIDFYTQMLAETDINTKGIKVNLIKKKLAELQQQLAATEMGVGAASNAIIRDQNEARSSSASIEQELQDRAEQNAGWQTVTSPVYGGSKYGDKVRGSVTRNVFDVSNVSIPGATPLPQQQGYDWRTEDTQMSTIQGYQPPSYMTPWLTPSGGVRPLGAQTQVNPLQQAALWEQGTMNQYAPQTIEDYLKYEPYIESVGNEIKARSESLKPKTFGYSSRWAKTMQR
jgi:hypothetical protein